MSQFSNNPSRQDAPASPSWQFIPRSSAALDLGLAFHEGWATVKSNFWALAGMMFVGTLISIAGSFLLAFIPVLGTVIATFFVSGPLAAGMMMLGVRLVRGEKVGLEALFQPYQKFGAICVVTAIQQGVFLVMGMVWTCMALLVGVSARTSSGGPGAAPSSAFGLSLLSLWCFMVPVYLAGLWLQIRLWFAQPLVLDERLDDLSGLDAIKLSWRLTAGQTFWPILGAVILTGLISLVSCLLLVVGVFLIGMPLMECVSGSLYRQLVFGFDPRYCEGCGYDLSGTQSARCPECGTPKPDQTYTNPFSSPQTE